MIKPTHDCKQQSGKIMFTFNKYIQGLITSASLLTAILI